MTEYEHKTVETKIGMTKEEIDDLLNRMTNEGWEYLMTLDSYPPRLTFRRKKGLRDLTEGPTETIGGEL